MILNKLMQWYDRMYMQLHFANLNKNKPRFPVFLVGIPRSGTTLMRLLLNNHPRISIPGETGILLQLYNSPGNPISFTNLLRFSPTSRAADALGSYVVEAYERLPLILKPKTHRGVINWLFSAYAKSQGKEFWGEKTPRHVDYVRDIIELFPEGTVLYMVRDPRAVVASYIRYKNAARRSPADVFISDTVEEAVSKYKRFMQSSISLDDITAARDIHFINYEELVFHPENVLRDVCEAMLRIEYRGKMLEYPSKAHTHLYSITSRKDGELLEWKLDNVRGVDPSLANRWKKELSEREICYINEHLREYLEWNRKVLRCKHWCSSQGSWTGERCEKTVSG